MTRSILGALTVPLALAAAPAYAADINLAAVDTGDGNYTFRVVRNAPVAGNNTDRFLFTVPGDMVGALTVAITNTGTGNNNIDFLSATLNGATLGIQNDGSYSAVFSLDEVPALLQGVNVLTIAYFAGSNAATFGGNVAFAPTSAVPESATWAMMILGMGLLGAAFRARRNGAHQTLAVSYS